MRTRLAIVLASLVAPLAPAARGDFVFRDGDFANASTFAIVVDDPAVSGVGPGTSTPSIARLAAGGNPGAFLQSTHPVVFGDSVFTGAVFGDSLYDPRASGAILDLTLSADVSQSAGGSTALNLVVEQGGRRYLSTRSTSFPQGGFRGVTLSAVRADEFEAVTFGGPTGVRPDFGAAGGALRFGYAFGNTVTGPGAGTNVLGLDNLTLTARAVPEPSALALIGLGLAGVACWRMGRRIAA